MEISTFPEHPPAGLEAMYGIVDALKKELDKRPLKGPVIEITMGGINPAFQGGHIAADLVWVLLLDAYLKGFRTAMTVASSVGSQTAYSMTAGFSTPVSLAYKDFEYNGTRPFASIARPPSAKVMMGDLEAFHRRRKDRVRSRL